MTDERRRGHQDDAEDLPDTSEEHEVTRREALETELMDRDESDRGEEIGDEID